MAQFGRALRSGRRGRVFESRRLDYTSVWPVGQAVKTTPSHGVNPGSIPGQVMMMRLLLMRQPRVILLDSESCSDATVAQLVAQRIRNA